MAAFRFPIYCALSLLAPALGGCGVADWFNPVPAGSVQGIVRYNGEPAAGKRVSLIGSGLPVRVTNQDGRYTFSGVPTGKTLQVHYQSNGDRPDVLPNEVASWDSQPFTLASGGQNVPAFDVAYNGLLYPDKGVALVVAANSPVPFHWSPVVDAKAYRLWLKDDSGSAGFTWSSAWSGAPTTILARSVVPGTYDWYVEIDAGSAGTGFSRERKLDLGAPDTPASPAPPGG